MRTLADALRQARERAPGAADRGLDPALAALEHRLVRKAHGRVSQDNPTARCDTCPRVTSADMMVGNEAGVYSCDMCRRRATRDERIARKRAWWERRRGRG